MSGRVHKSILNAEVNLFFYFISLVLSFFSRKIFLECLGAEFIGLIGTLTSILGYLNLAELGIGSCISFFLYKPLQANDQKEIQNILSVFGYLYKYVGIVVLILGSIVSIFFFLIFGSSNLSLGLIYFAFYSLLASSLIGYFINYQQILLSADQKNYLIAIYVQSATIFKILLQIYLAYYYKNLYTWIFIEFVFSLLACIIINWKIKKEYPWLHTNKKEGKTLLKKYPTILTSTRQIFIHKIKDVILMRSDEIFVFMFVSLKMVAYYGNYTLIISRIGQIFSAALDSINAGIGNLIAEGDKDNIMKVFWEMLTIRHFIAGFLCFVSLHLVEPFISIWLGTEYILSKDILLLLSIYVYISSSRGVVDMYNHAHGLYADTWAAWAELAINISITFVAGYYWGIAGVLLGKVISTTIIIILWKPYYLFTAGLHLKYKNYWSGASRNFFASFVSIIITHHLISQLKISAYSNFYYWMLFSAIAILIYLIVNLSMTMLICRGAKDCFNRISIILKRK